MSGAARTRWAVGVDMGGTFIDRLCAENGIAPSELARIVHGSTVVTNLLLEQNAPPIAVITTAGVRDMLALGRQDRRALYEPVIAPATPEAALFPAHLRFEPEGRVDAQGQEIAALDLGGLDRIVAALAGTGGRAAAVCLLFAHRNPQHEQQVRTALQRKLPGLLLSLSSEGPAPNSPVPPSISSQANQGTPR
jgi:N-methylhydantoinase A